MWVRSNGEDEANGAQNAPTAERRLPSSWHPPAQRSNSPTSPTSSFAKHSKDMAADSIILEEDFDPNYEPTEDEVIEYAKWLGMELDADKDLWWIAREGLKAPLPENWKPCETTDTKEIYYFNFLTGASTWDHPCDEYYRNLYEEEKKKIDPEKLKLRRRNLGFNEFNPWSQGKEEELKRGVLTPLANELHRVLGDGESFDVRFPLYLE